MAKYIPGKVLWREERSSSADLSGDNVREGRGCRVCGTRHSAYQPTNFWNLIALRVRKAWTWILKGIIKCFKSAVSSSTKLSSLHCDQNLIKSTICRSTCRIGWCRRGCGTCGAYQLLELGPDSREGNRRSHLPFHFQPALLPLHTFFFFENFAMASGVKLSDGVKHAYDDIKKHSKYLYAIFIIKVYSVTCYASIKK